MNELGKKIIVFLDAMPCSLLSTYISEKPAASVKVGGGRCSSFCIKRGHILPDYRVSSRNSVFFIHVITIVRTYNSSMNWVI